MIKCVCDWMANHWVEISGALLGMAYVFFSVKQHIVTWLLGLLTSLFYIAVFFSSKFYADMALQFYYVYISIFGWILWVRGETGSTGKLPLLVRQTNKKQLVVLSAISLVLFIFLYLILEYLTDSPVPVGDAFTTALSIVATWMLAKKRIEHWLVWIVVDIVSLVLYVYKGLYPTAVLFLIYTLAAFWGYFEWKKDLARHNHA
jgi:nicotinamide mononucleotide transporter